MKNGKLLVIALASLAVSNLYGAQTVEDMGDIYESRCANCHGITANGVPKLTEQPGVEAEEADAKGVASQAKTNIYGPALNGYSKEELTTKIMGLRSKSFDSESYHSVMQANLKHIEAREGKISDEMMAEYIYDTFGGGAK